MSTFVVLPPRECLEQAVVEFTRRVLPGLHVNPAVAEAFVAALEFEANRNDDTYFIHREDLPCTRDTVGDLIDAFGAEPGDHVIEIGAVAATRPSVVRRCVIRPRVSDRPAVR